MKDPASFKERVAKKLGCSADDSVFAVAWQYCGGPEDEQMWRGGDTKKKREIEQELAEACERFLDAHREASAAEADGSLHGNMWATQLRGRSSTATTDIADPDWVFYAEPSEAENERARGIAAYYAALAREERYVITFRDAILGGRTLSPDAARAWATSIAARFIDPDMYYTLRRLRDPPEHPTLEILDIAVADIRSRTHIVKLQDTVTGATMTSHLSLGDYVVRNVLLSEEEIEVFEGTTLDLLRSHGERLAKQYGWDRERAMWFILTNTPPPVHPLDAAQSFFLLGGPGQPWTAVRQEVTITIAPWVSETTLLRAYRRLRHDLRGKQGRQSLRTLSLFRFIMERDGLKPHSGAGRRGGVKWTARMDEWKDLCEETHPEWIYTDRGNFRDAYYDVAKHVIGPMSAPKAYVERMNAIANEQQRRRADSHRDSQEGQ